MIWVHTYKIGKKIVDRIHYDEAEAQASLAVLGGKVRNYVEAGKPVNNPPVLEYLGTNNPITAMSIINNKQRELL
ncbi:hypothetical protein [Escherichia phage vB_EcoP_PAS59]|uniref:Uncharacterized protein n=1 Tax=Escherichia phage vB_EcoP_PAS59 TaxID=3053873 RepID=A0AA51VJT8_9CAUD|nr:hypothetical protein [Escherichia phage vB_EcoP_PAS59]